MTKLKVLLSVCLVFVVLAWITTLFVVPSVYPAVDANGALKSPAIENPGIFGDMFGATNALFTGLSLVALIYTLLVQQQQLDQQEQQQVDLAKALESLGESLSSQAQALTVVGSQLSNEAKRKALQYRIDANKKRIKKIETEMPSTWSPGTASEKRRNALAKEIKRLTLAIESLERELEGLEGEE